MKVAIYPGSFDPFTLGHYSIISSVVDLFDTIYIAVGNNPNKKYLFDLKERENIIKEMFSGYGKQKVVSFQDKYLIDFARELKCNYIIRGIRNVEDFEFERKLQDINDDLLGNKNEIKTLYISPKKEYVNYSSSVVKGLVGPKNWEEVVKQMVPYPTLLALKEKFAS